jgi:hypothetical protein
VALLLVVGKHLHLRLEARQRVLGLLLLRRILRGSQPVLLPLNLAGHHLDLILGVGATIACFVQPLCRAAHDRGLRLQPEHHNLNALDGRGSRL